MNLVYDNNVDSSAFGSCDISWDQGDLLSSIVYMSLLTNRRAAIDEIENEANRQGWWANNNLGSKLWLLRRRSITPAILNTVNQYCEQALQWIIDEGIAASITTNSFFDNDNPEVVKCIINIYKQDGSLITIRFNELWTTR